MCGITGVVSSERIDRATVESMTLALAHRGPDAQGIYLDPTQTMALGHRRLSIIDLSAEANQPFFTTDGRYAIVFNGEIYNFQHIANELGLDHGIKFRTHSDTEVIVAAFSVWGKAMVNKLEGMFALAILDQQEHTLHLFRDRIGKKPLYYFQSNGVFAFASEIKSLLKHPLIQREKKINHFAVSTFLHLGYIPEPHTIYSHVHKFPAGHIGELRRNGTLTTQPFWCIEKESESAPLHDDRQAIDHLSELMDQAVKERLISDVPLGTFLSGGTDSSLVSAIAAKFVSTPLKTFSIGFKESKNDESRYARAVARHLNSDHNEYILEEREAAEQVETYLRHFDEPFADTSAIPTMLVSRLARKDVKVVLTGDGGDELFQGYGTYAWADRLDRTSWKVLRGPLGTVLRASGRSRLERVGHLLEHPIEGGMRSHLFSQEQYFFSQREIREGLLKHPQALHLFAYDESLPRQRQLSQGERQALFDLRYYLKDDLLVKVDRSSMLYALECRCPLLDHRVIEYAFSLDARMKKRNGETKWIEKQLLYRYVPRQLVDRPKQGFSIPLSAWMKGDLHYLMETFLSNQAIEEAGLCNVAFVADMKKRYLSGTDYLYHRLWAVLVLHKWWKENQ